MVAGSHRVRFEVVASSEENEIAVTGSPTTNTPSVRTPAGDMADPEPVDTDLF